MTTILEAKNICKTFDHPEKVELLKEVNLEIKHGESIAITGASGEGKTTLLHILGTLEEFNSGTLKFNNKEIDDREKLRSSHFGFIFQNFNLLDDLPLIDNVLMPDRIARKKIDVDKGIYLLSLVGLEKRAKFPAKLLSGGEKQRATIARSFCNNPKIIFADEPSGNLDHFSAEMVHKLLFSCTLKFKTALILVTHNLSLASCCKEVYNLNSGKLLKV